MDGMVSRALAAALATSALAVGAGVPVEFTLPGGGQYLVSLAATERDDPARIVSTFVLGECFDSTVSNRFTVEWNGLDDNYMPLPPGEYGVKGVFSTAHRWEVDGEMHAVSARWVGGPGDFLPRPDAPGVAKLPLPFYGDPVNSPLLDIDIAPDGVAVLGFQYLENGRSCPRIDLNKPKGFAQFLEAYPSGGAGGGPCATTDGETVWACSHDGAPYFIYRPDMKPFGPDRAPFRRGGYLPRGIVTDMACVRTGGRSFVYVVERGTLEKYKAPWGGDWWRESADGRTDVITVMAGDDGRILARVPVATRPTAVKAAGDALYVLYRPDGVRPAIGSMALRDGIPQTAVKVFDVPAEIDAVDFARDSKGRFFFADATRNKLFRTDARGRVTGTAGRLARQESGSYDPESMMAPRRLAAWRDASGADRVMVVEHDGPNRISEWDASTMKYLGEYQNFQLKANCGYAADPDHPEMVYIPGHNEWLNRFKVDYATGEWRLDAVFDGVPDDGKSGLAKMRCVRVNGRLYFASVLSGHVFRLADDGRRVVRAGSVRDVEGAPPGVFTYHGQNFTDDLVYIAAAQGSREVWRCAPAGFTKEGDVVFGKWEKVLEDPVFAAIAAGRATALFGGNELADSYSSDWMQVDAAPGGGDVFVQASGGPSYSANFRPQHKITRYRPDGKGGYDMVWRVGRTQLPGNPPSRGQIAGAMRLTRPINGVVSVVDQSRSGVFLYTEDGIYLDTLFAGDAGEGVYVQPGEFFVGSVYANKDNGRIYYASGKYTPFVYELRGWDLKTNPARPLPLAKSSRRVELKVADVADPYPEALRLRQLEGRASVAEFAPLANGWDGVEPVKFSDAGASVEVRCLYTPDELRFRWKVRRPGPIEIGKLASAERLFAHDQGADTLGVYLQGDPDAPASGPSEGRPGDVRLTYGIFEGDGGAPCVVGVGFYPEWKRPGARPQMYKTAAGGEALYAHVGGIAGGRAQVRIDEDRRGYELIAVVPRAAVPVKAPFAGGLRTRLNFDANLGGHHRFWWSNTDGSANRETYDEPTESRFYPGAWGMCRFNGLGDGLLLRSWAVLGPFGGPGAERFNGDPGNKDEVRAFFDRARFAPDGDRPEAAKTYSGEELRGWWKDAPASLGWRLASPPATDVRVQLGFGSQVWYATTAVYSPADAEVGAEFFSHFMTHCRWSLNGEELKTGEFATESERALRTVARPADKVKLRRGWNTFKCRAFCVGYPPFKVGLRLLAPEATLWTLRNAPFAQ